MENEMDIRVLQADTPTSNGNVYPRVAIQAAIERWKEQKSKIPVTVDVNDDFVSTGLDITKIAGVVDSLSLNEDGTVIAKIVILATPAAQLLKEVDTPEFVMCSVGKLRKDGDTKIVEELEFQYVAMTLSSAIVYPSKSE